MEIQETRYGSALVLAVDGRLDIDTADALRDALFGCIAAADANRLVLDFTRLEYISSAGLRVLMIAAKQARSTGLALAICGMQPLVSEIFQISRFHTLIACHDTLEQALADAPASQAAPARAAPAAEQTGYGFRAHFWGTRGSLPAPISLKQLRAKMANALVAGAGRKLDNLEKANAFLQELPFHAAGTYGGNTSCVELRADDGRIVLLDMGSGARLAGLDAMRRLAGRPGEFHVFMSHLHWDHLMGFPFFVPAYVPGQKIRIYGCHSLLEYAFRRQQAAPSFPVDFSLMGADIEFVSLEPGRTYGIAGYQVSAQLQLHGGDSYAYRFERDGKVLVYSTDAEHKPENGDDVLAFVELFRNADLVIFDSMYSLADTVSIREDWGHSSNVVGVELCQQAGVRRLVLFHHEPVSDDATLDRLWQEARRLEEITRRGQRLDVVAAYDGLELEV